MALQAPLRASSHLWEERREVKAATAFEVVYGGGRLHIPAGARHWVDSHGAVLMGWHGSYDPPCGMDGEPMFWPAPAQAADVAAQRAARRAAAVA